MPYALEFIQFVYEKGLTLDVEAVFEKNGLAKYFSLFITRTDVSKSKPDPESYNLCVSRLGIPKEECIVFEDTVNDVKSALAAGITCYAIQSNVRAHQKLKIADELFLSFANAKEFMLEKGLI